MPVLFGEFQMQDLMLAYFLKCFICAVMFKISLPHSSCSMENIASAQCNLKSNQNYLSIKRYENDFLGIITYSLLFSATS